VAVRRRPVPHGVTLDRVRAEGDPFDDVPPVVVERAEVHLIELPLRFRFETSYGTWTSRRVPILELHADGAVGLGEGVMESHLPLYLDETVPTAMPLVEHLLTDHVVGRALASPDAFTAAVAHLRGHRMAKAMVETALWDLWARRAGVPLASLLGGVRTVVACGIVVGIRPDTAATVDATAGYLEAGARRVKLKIAPGWDLEPVAAARDAFPDAPLAADANATYTLDDLDRLRVLDEHGLVFLEQPLAYDDLVDHADLQRELVTPLCLDESITGAAAARHALRLGAARVLNVKPGRVGGHGEARRIDALARAAGVPLWCGGMLETGVGRAHNLHLASLPGFTEPADVWSSSRYWVDDVVEQPLECVDGTMPVPSGDGIGVTLDRAVVDRHRVGRMAVP
jgi:o-succinylbenzoate synthase